MTARCNACGEEWPRDPALEVECPDCRASIGSPCRRPSGHGCAVHGARDRLAMDWGFLSPCSATAFASPALSSDELPLFAFKDESAITT
jgi:hypothetical protein